MTDRKRRSFSRRVSRRQALGQVAGATAGLALGAGVCAPFVHAAHDRRLRYASNGVTAFPQIAERARQDLGIEIEFQVYSNIDLLKLSVTQPNSLELLEIAFDSLPFLIELNKIRGIAANRIKSLEDISSIFIKGHDGVAPKDADGLGPSDTAYLSSELSGRSIATKSEWLAAVPVTFNADSLGVREEMIETDVTHWKSLLDPALSGRVAITGIPSIGIIDAAFALESAGEIQYANKGEMTREEITFTVDRLIDRKKTGHFKGIWHTFPESVDLMLKQDVVLQSMWAPAITLVRSSGMPCTMADLVEGYRGWARGITFPRNISDYKRDMAYEFFNWHLDGYPGAVLSRQGYYSAVPHKTRSHLSTAEWDYWYDGKPAPTPILSPRETVFDNAGATRTGGSMENRVRRISCWNSFMREHRHLRREWQRFLEA